MRMVPLANTRLLLFNILLPYMFLSTLSSVFPWWHWQTDSLTDCLLAVCSNHPVIRAVITVCITFLYPQIHPHLGDLRAVSVLLRIGRGLSCQVGFNNVCHFLSQTGLTGRKWLKIVLAESLFSSQTGLPKTSTMTCLSHLNCDYVFALDKARKITAVGNDPLGKKGV